jgi:DNA ligase-1
MEPLLSLTMRKKDAEWIATVRETESGTNVQYAWGKRGGKTQTKVDTYTVGKQKRTALQQARFEILSDARKKIRKGYECDSDATLGMDPAEMDTLFAEARLAEISPAPMLAETFSAKRKAALPPAVRLFVQPKLDGVRCLANLNTGALFSRSRKEHAALFHISAAVKALRDAFPCDVTWLDGELYAHGMGFQTITSLSKKSESDTEQKLQLWVYDVVSPLPFGERAALLHVLPPAQLLFPSPSPASVVVGVPTTAIVFDKEIDDLHVQYVHAHFEGSMLRVDGVGYEIDKRSLSLLKRKDFFQEEFTVVGLEKEAHAETLGAVRIVDAEGIETCATPAMTDAEKLVIWRNAREYIGKTATVKFQGKTDSGALRFPILVGFPDAKDMAEKAEKGETAKKAEKPTGSKKRNRSTPAT